MALKLYNSLSHEREDFLPVEAEEEVDNFLPNLRLLLVSNCFVATECV